MRRSGGSLNPESKVRIIIIYNALKGYLCHASSRFSVITEIIIIFAYLSKTSQIIFDLHPGFFHMEDEKGNKLHLFKKYFKMMFFTIQVFIDPYCYSF